MAKRKASPKSLVRESLRKANSLARRASMDETSAATEADYAFWNNVIRDIERALNNF